MATPFPFTAGQVLTAAQLNNITTLPINDRTANYVLVAGDVGKRVIMNNAGATTITVDDAVFGVGDTIFIANKGAGTCTVTAGAGVTINTSGSLALAQYGGGTLVALSASVFTFFPAGGITYGTATGGSSSSITVGGVNYTLLTFTGDSTLTVTKAGLFDVLCIGGGGGGVNNAIFGAGGAGGFQSATFYLDANQSIVVGAGGAVGSSLFGGTSRLGDLFSVCGGASCDTTQDTGICGASTAGSRAGVPSRGNVPGQGTGGTTNKGGCGAGGISTSGTGGVGKETNTFTGGASSVLANGGSDGGGAGAANTGNGGGNGNVAGGSGIVYVRFKV